MTRRLARHSCHPRRGVFGSIDEDASTKIFYCGPTEKNVTLEEDEPDYFALPKQSNNINAGIPTEEQEGWAEFCNCGTWDEESVEEEEEEYFILPSDNDNNNNVFKRRQPSKNPKSSKIIRAPPTRRRVCRRVVYRRRLFRRERVDITTGKKQVVLKPNRRSKKNTPTTTTTFGWVPKPPPKYRAKDIARILHRRLVQLLLTPVTVLLVAPAATILPKMDQIMSKSFFPKKKNTCSDITDTSSNNSEPMMLFGNEIEVAFDGSQNEISMPIQRIYYPPPRRLSFSDKGLREAPPSCAAKPKIKYRLHRFFQKKHPFKEEEERKGNMLVDGRALLFGNEIEVAYDGTKNTISMPIQGEDSLKLRLLGEDRYQPPQVSRNITKRNKRRFFPSFKKRALRDRESDSNPLLIFGNEIEVASDGSKNAISMPLYEV